ncbi:DUF883 family protein [Acidihalobacter ferrooxydans]|uniref:DUF883 domain-containing protein n=1 Tax=Acidihalobacter ferrooxydans TaxID=1765967 RepID=A0A1P8UF59_9GAMM|nr:DUF883 family protein [Acidihalobacter ferrooxydans]APZ42482.1 hypothetical protein BW247_04755 [Acidihalobacter ferrooxydans]
MSDTPKDDLEALRADFDKLREDMGKLTDSLKDMGAEQAHEARGNLNDRLDAAREKLRAGVGSAGQRGHDYYEQVESSVGERPLISLAAAFGAGFVIAKLLDLGGRR